MHKQHVYMCALRICDRCQALLYDAVMQYEGDMRVEIQQFPNI